MTRILTVQRSARIICRRMRPHLHHQKAWQRQEDGTIRCTTCREAILTPEQLMRSGIRFLDPAGQEAVRNLVARWIRDNSPESARIISPPRRPT